MIAIVCGLVFGIGLVLAVSPWFTPPPAWRPWGPWKRIKLIDRFAQETVFFFQLPAKWQQPDHSAWLAFSGIDARDGQEWDALNIVKVRFVRPRHGQ